MTTGDIWKQLQTLNQRAASGEEIYEDAISIGQSLAPRGDAGKIAIGVIVATLTTRYGQHTVDTFAASVGIRRSTCYSYRQMVELYGLDCLYSHLIENRTTLTLSHFKEALVAGEQSIAWTFVQKWEAENTTLEHAHIDMLTWQGKPLPPYPVVENAPVRITDVNLAAGTITVFVGDYVGKLANHTGKDLTMTIKESETKA